MRLFDVSQLQVDESALTGESHVVSKQTDALEERDLTLGDRLNMVFNGTMVTRGHGKGIVVATGMDSEMGHIAAMLEKKRVPEHRCKSVWPGSASIWRWRF
ncbi:MAG: hypothetical protein H6940_04995 [Burkholderiales bacterium]|nr:hypothetical protein [Burkholderiales bacterium]